MKTLILILMVLSSGLTACSTAQLGAFGRGYNRGYSRAMQAQANAPTIQPAAYQAPRTENCQSVVIGNIVNTQCN